LVNGSTCGVEAAILATCTTGDKLSCLVHSSAIAGLTLRCHPVFVNWNTTQFWTLPTLSPNGVATALEQHPTQGGDDGLPDVVCGDVVAIATLAHQYNIPLLVDEAHGAHFGFHPDHPRPLYELGQI